MTETHHFVQVDFIRFKAFESFSFKLRNFNIIVGPNNSGKSTILAAFRILAAAMRKASTRKPEMVRGPTGKTLGYSIDLKAISVAEENIFYNYDDANAASITFKLSNKNTLMLYFPEHGTCILIVDAQGKQIKTPTAFKSQFNCQIGFVPILGPVEHHENLFAMDAARLALFNYKAARNFRNIWYHYPEKFDVFRSTLKQTWPGMDIEPPVVDTSYEKPRLHMFCPEDRIPREIFWAGFGFQVWCQMLTHLIQSNDKSLFLIDEPDIYLHSDLQRQLLSLLRNLGPDILIATHSTEIITEAETDDIVLISKKRKSARRIKNPSQLEEVFAILGSNLNPILTQIAKTRRALFVEGKDFQILAKFARKLSYNNVSNRSDFAVVPVEGFNPERIRSLKNGIETTLGGKILAAAIMDKDYRSEEECALIIEECQSFCAFATIHKRKEIENFLLIPRALDRAVSRKISDHEKRNNIQINNTTDIYTMLDGIAAQRKDYVIAQYLAERRRFERANSPSKHETEISVSALKEFDVHWRDTASRYAMLPGKDVISEINKNLQEKYGISLTPTAIIDEMHVDEIPDEMKNLVLNLSQFSKEKIK